MSILRDLLEIKTFREHKAEMAVFMQRGVLAEAIAELHRAERGLEEFRDWASQRERELFDDLCARVVRLSHIQDVQLAVGELRVEDQHRVQTVQQASSTREQEQEVLDERKQAHAEASRVREKFVELARLHAEEALRELERREDLELEEAAEVRRDRIDWADYREEDAP